MTVEPQRERIQLGDTMVTDLSGVSVSGPSGVVWGLDSPQLNANLVTLDGGDNIAMHNNDEVDVLLIVSSGYGEVTIDNHVHVVAADSVVLIPRGAARSIRSLDRMAYYSVHARRAGLDISPK